MLDSALRASPLCRALIVSMKIEVLYIITAYVVGILSIHLINHENYYMYSGKIQGIAFLTCSMISVLFFAKTSSIKKTAVFIPALVMSVFGGVQMLIMVIWLSIAGFAP